MRGGGGDVRKEVSHMPDSTRSKLGTRQALSDGRIKVTVSHGYRRDGRQRRVSAIAENEQDAERVALKLAADLGRRPDLGSGLTLSRWWLAYSATKGQRLTNATYRRYKGDMEHIWLPALGERDISLIGRVDVQDVLLTCRSRSAATHAKATLSAILTQAVRDGHLSKNPVRSGGYELPGDVGAEDMSGIDYDDDPFAAIEGAANVWDATTVLRAMPVLRGVPLETCWLAMVGAGLRREEALALRWKDVRRVMIDGHEVTQIAVHRANTALDGIKRTKTQRSIRIVTMMEPFGARLWELRGGREDMVCDVSISNIGHRWRNMWEPEPTSKHARKADRRRGIMLAAGIPYVPLGRMRATHETYMQQAGVLDSINAAAHGHSQKVSYEHYQRANDVSAARQAGDFLLIEGGEKALLNANGR